MGPIGVCGVHRFGVELGPFGANWVSFGANWGLSLGSITSGSNWGRLGFFLGVNGGTFGAADFGVNGGAFGANWGLSLGSIDSGSNWGRLGFFFGANGGAFVHSQSLRLKSLGARADHSRMVFTVLLR